MEDLFNKVKKEYSNYKFNDTDIKDFINLSLKELNNHFSEIDYNKIYFRFEFKNSNNNDLVDPKQFIDPEDPSIGPDKQFIDSFIHDAAYIKSANTKYVVEIDRNINCGKFGFIFSLGNSKSNRMFTFKNNNVFIAYEDFAFFVYKNSNDFVAQRNHIKFNFDIDSMNDFVKYVNKFVSNSMFF